MKILNLGCGRDTYGTHRVDLYKTPATTHVLNMDKEKLPFKSNYFDEVRMHGSFEHLKNLGIVIDEIYRVMKKGAKLDLGTDNAGFIFYHIMKRKEHNEITKRWYKMEAFGHAQGEDAHYHLFVASHLKLLFRQFSKTEVSYFYPAPFLGVKTLMRLLPCKLGASQIYLEAIK